MKRFLAVMLALIFALAALLTGCAGEGGKKNADEYAVKDDLLKSARADEGHDRVFYEIFVGSFSDSDGDGTGDLRGIINRMDYSQTFVALRVHGALVAGGILVDEHLALLVGVAYQGDA